MLGSLTWPSYWSLVVSALTVMATVNANYEKSHFSFLERTYCTGRQTCHECIQYPHCAWCSAPEFRGSRCFSPAAVDPDITIVQPTSLQCPEEFVQNPESRSTVLQQDELTQDHSSSTANVHLHESISNSSAGGSSNSFSNNVRQKIVQLSPQKMKLELRLHERHRISFSYAQADFPVDIYYLTNFRQPIENGTNYMIDLGDLLVESLHNVTSDLRLGFGSTISHSRFSSMMKPYGFQNMVSLSQDTRTFADSVRNFANTDNFTSSDGGPDAVMQAILCRSEIGWRSNSYKILVVATDTAFPYNIDTLEPVMLPNNERCILNGREYSVYSSSQSHPTSSQIKRLAKQNGIHIIWTVTNEQYDKFHRLSMYMEDSFVQRFNESLSTIPELIQTQYRSISSSLKIKDTATDNSRVKYFSSCGLEDGIIHETSRCDGLKVGTVVQFFAEIEPTTCPTDKSQWFQRFHIYPVGVNENLTIDLRLICDCECESPSNLHYGTQSPVCHQSGTLKCGICECDEGYFGQWCECNSFPERYGQYDFCRPDNTTLVDCSGRGICICGHCNCHERSNSGEVISGRFCECDNFSCDRNNGILCSDHGTCQCGQCECESGWTGPSCSCRSSNEACVAPDGAIDNILCSDHGECVCGECRCQESAGMRYFGRFCDRFVSERSMNSESEEFSTIQSPHGSE